MTALAIAVAVLAILNFAASRAVRRSGLYEPHEKRRQYWLIWLLPLLGAITAWMVLREASRPERPHGDGISGNPYVAWNEPDENEGYASHHHGGHDGH